MTQASLQLQPLYKGRFTRGTLIRPFCSWADWSGLCGRLDLKWFWTFGFAWTFSGSEPSGFRACKVPLAASTWRRWMKLRKKWNQSQGQCQVYKSQTFGESDYHVAHQTDWFTAILMYLQNSQHFDILLAIISMHHTQDQLFTVARFVFHLHATTKAPIRFPQMYF